MIVFGALPLPCTQVSYLGIIPVYHISPYPRLALMFYIEVSIACLTIISLMTAFIDRFIKAYRKIVVIEERLEYLIDRLDRLEQHSH